MNKKGFVFVETIVTITVLLVSLMVIYVSYSRFIVGEKRRLYYDDMSYVYKTMSLRDLMYEEVVYYYDTKEYHNVDALKKWVKSDDYLIILNGQSFFEDGKTSTKFRSLMDELNVKMLIYIPNYSTFKSKKSNIDFFALSKNMPYIRSYLERLTIPCEHDNSCSSYYQGIIISVINEYKDGTKKNSSENYKACMQNGDKTSMQCQEANYLSWVYA